MDVSSASLLLVMYPVMMASDILLQKSKYVPVGEDQVAHVEMARYLARKFNKAYTDTIPIPNVLSLGKPVRVKSLVGEGKMSKTNPSGAILLDDPIEVSLNKIRKAQSAFAKEMTDSLETLILIGKFVSNEEEKEEIDIILSEHLKGENVMGELKRVINVSLERYLKEFQSRKSEIDDSDIEKFLESGKAVAQKNAQDMIQEVRKVMELQFV